MRVGRNSVRNHVLHNVDALRLGEMSAAANKARAFYRCIAAIEQRVSTLRRAHQLQLRRTCSIARELVRKADRGSPRKRENSKQKHRTQTLLLAAVAAAARIAIMCKKMQTERVFAALNKSSAAMRLCRFLRSVKGVVQVRRQAHLQRVRALHRRCAGIIVKFFKLFLPRMRRLRRTWAAAVVAESLRELRRGWGAASVRAAMTTFMKKVRIVQKQARTFLSRAAANKRWLLWQFMKIEKQELLRVYGSGKKGNAALKASDMGRLMMANDVRQVAIEQLWKLLRRDFSIKYTQFQSERKMHFIRIREMAVFRRGMLSYVGLNHSALNRLPEDVRMDLLTAYNPPVPPSYKECMRPSDNELLQVVRIAQYDSGRPLDPSARRGVSAYAKQRRKQSESRQSDRDRAQEQQFALLEKLGP